jgi:hypothetical protein
LEVGLNGSWGIESREFLGFLEKIENERASTKQIWSEGIGVV